MLSWLMTVPARSKLKCLTYATGLRTKSKSRSSSQASKADRCCSVNEDEIEAQTDALRKKLTAEMNGATTSGRGLKSHQVHELAAAKIVESEKLRKALGIREDYEEGSHWRKQEERLRDSTMEKGKEESRRESDR